MQKIAGISGEEINKAWPQSKLRIIQGMERYIEILYNMQIEIAIYLKTDVSEHVSHNIKGTVWSFTSSHFSITGKYGAWVIPYDNIAAIYIENSEDFKKYHI